MKIAYVAPIRMPTEKAHGFQIMRVCAVLSSRGHSVELFVPAWGKHDIDEIFEFYAMDRTFKVTRISSPRIVDFSKILGRFAYYIQTAIFARSVLRNGGIGKDVIVFSREPEVIAYFAKRGYSAVYNAHMPSRRAKYYLHNARGIVCNSEETAKVIRQMIKLPIAVIHNGTDVNPYHGQPKDVLRSELGLPLKRKIVLYAGGLFPWKGINVIIDAARRTEDISYYIIGGTSEQIQALSREHLPPNNVTFLGYKKRVHIPKYLAAADVLVLPNLPNIAESELYTSPIKLFEYLASGVPVVASDLPSTRNVVSANEVILVQPGRGDALVAGILEALNSSTDRARRARDLSELLTWDAHAAKLERFIQELRS